MIKGDAVKPPSNSYWFLVECRRGSRERSCLLLVVIDKAPRYLRRSPMNINTTNVSRGG